MRGSGCRCRFAAARLGEFALEQQRADAAFAATMCASLQAWNAANPDIGDGERAFLAALDSANYTQKADGTYEHCRTCRSIYG